MSKPVAVLISDVHYNVHTLKLADAAMRQAIARANELSIPLIVAGDLHDTKANLRGECVNAMLETFSLCNNMPFVMRGNHDSLNEKSEEHSLNFLKHQAYLVDRYTYDSDTNLHLFAYFNNTEELLRYRSNLPDGETCIMHQGLQSSNSGDYFQDHSALAPKDVAGLRIISGHYHTRQTIALPNGGQWDFVGNPYTLTWGEAKDPVKGYQILYDDGSLEFVATGLRRHAIEEIPFDNLKNYKLNSFPTDLLWVKISGTQEQLSTLSRQKVADALSLPPTGWKLDFLPADTTPTQIGIITPVVTQNVLLDNIIDSMQNTSTKQKIRVKELWKSKLYNSTISAVTKS